MIQLINASADEFYKESKDKKVYCFGCGKYLERYAQESFYIKPEKVIDNYKTGTCVLNGDTVSIITLSAFFAEDVADKVLVITSSYYNEIIDQLSEWKGMEDVLCYIPFPFFYEKAGFPELRQLDKDNTTHNDKCYQIWERHPELFNAGSKAPDDIRCILERSGIGTLIVDACNDALPDDDWKLARGREGWEKVSQTISGQSVLFIQHPSWGRLKKRYEVLSALKDQGTKIVVFVHDYEKLRGELYEGYMIEEESFIFELADILIVHNDRMRERFIENGYKDEKLLCLEIFDYLCENNVPENRGLSRDVIVAGNLNADKNPHISMLPSIKDVSFKLFGDGYVDDLEHPNVIFQGKEAPYKIPCILPDGFGLVWGGDSLDTCSGKSGEYLRINNPHKLSLYIAANLPVIVWKESATAEFVKKHNIGFTVSSLHELPDKLRSIDEHQYSKYVENVKVVSRQLRSGYYTMNAARNALTIMGIETEKTNDGI